MFPALPPYAALAVVSGFTVFWAVLDWLAVAFRLRWTEGTARPFTTIGLIGVALALDAMTTLQGRLLMVALAFSLAGDVFLLLDIRRNLLGGLSAFFLAHLVLLTCFLVIGLEDTTLLGRAVVGLLGWSLLAGGVLHGILRRLGRATVTAVALYVVILAALVVGAALTGDAWVFVGASIFVLGDVLLGRTWFVHRHWWTAMLAMMTHHAGQALIVYGVLR